MKLIPYERNGEEFTITLTGNRINIILLDMYDSHYGSSAEAITDALEDIGVRLIS